MCDSEYACSLQNIMKTEKWNEEKWNEIQKIGKITSLGVVNTLLKIEPEKVTKSL